jgi:dTDP-4-dehydrorhamnose reductase
LTRKHVAGVYHVSGEGQGSWFDFATAILAGGRAHGLLDASRPVTLNPLTTAQYPTKAKRPAWSVLSKDKLKRDLGITMPHWQDSLKTFLSTLSRL